MVALGPRKPNVKEMRFAATAAETPVPGAFAGWVHWTTPWKTFFVRAGHRLENVIEQLITNCTILYL